MKAFGAFAGAGSLAILATCLLGLSQPPLTGSAGAAEGGQQSAAQPVEPDMHEFMEYVFQPTYQRLRSQMKSEPADNQGWKAIKADALILAEGGNLLLIRQPEKDRSDWVQYSTRVRQSGGELYRAAQAKDAKATRRHYESMLTQCNACHDQFAGGEHQLKP